MMSSQAAEARVGTEVVEVGRDVLSPARQAAQRLRDALTQEGTLVVHLLSSPGAGKTSLLEATARAWAGSRRLGVLTGDIATDRDRDRLAPLAPTVQLTTGGACHLEIGLIERGLRELNVLIAGGIKGEEPQPPEPLDFLFIENVGNLVCPASHDLGEHLRVALLSTTEGDDKPGKYPKAFRTSQAMVISKLDLLPYVPFSVEAAIADARRIQPQIAAFPLSARDGQPAGPGLDDWLAYLDQRREELLRTRTERP